MSINGLLTWDDGEVRLGGELLPGNFVNQSIRGMVRFDESKKDNQSGRHKVPLGYEDADITITMDLLCDADGDCYEKLEAISKIFRADRNANPKVYAVANRHCQARGIGNVVFSGLDSWETNEDDVISVTLMFIEHLPPVIRREKQVAATQKSGGAPAVKATPKTSPKVVKDEDNAFIAGFKAGFK